MVTYDSHADAVTVWTRAGSHHGRWILDETGEAFSPAGALLAPARGCAVAFDAVLDLDPNRMTADDVIELAELVAGPVPNYTHRRRRAA